jgi:hypothetical protein
MKIPTHLESLIKKDPQVTAIVYEAIAAFTPWIGRSQLPLFSEYTDHSLKHIEEVIETAFGLITDDARALLSTLDAAVLVIGICLHDCAMHLTEDGFSR